jgi:hypothetical protein
MTDHIYGRENILSNSSRPHMFIAELYLYLTYLEEQLEENKEPGQYAKKKKYFVSFFQNLRNGIMYYRNLPGVAAAGREQFFKDLFYADSELDSLNYQYAISPELVN